MSDFDCIVLGIGGMGSSACFHLSQRGLKTLGLERYSIGHDFGTSHGHTRLIRKAYFESPDYIPLLDRSYELWRELEKLSGEQLFYPVGLIMMGDPKKGEAVPGVLESAKKFNISHEILTTQKLQERFPQFTAPKNAIGVLEPSAGYLLVEKGVKAFVTQARRLGAVVKDSTPVIRWSERNHHIEVETHNESYTTDKLVLTLGPWSGEWITDLKLPITIHRVVQSWFQSGLSTGPCFAFDEPPHFLYGFPALPGVGLKAALHAMGNRLATADSIDRNILATDYESLSDLLRSRVRGIESPIPLRSSACFYSMTPDSHFVIDNHPKMKNVFYAAGFSGHGFKFTPVIGEILADLVSNGKTNHPIEFLRYRW